MAPKRPVRITKAEQARVTRARSVKGHIRELAVILGTAGAAQRIGVSERTVRRWKKEGVPKSRRQSLASVIVTPSEYRRHDATEALAKARKAKRTPQTPIVGKFGPKSTKVETVRYVGHTVNQHVRASDSLIVEHNVEALKQKIMRAAMKLRRKRGGFIVRLHMVGVGQAFGYPTGADPLRGKKGESGKTPHQEPLSYLTESTQYARATEEKARDRIRNAYRHGKLNAPKTVEGLEVLVDTLLGNIADNPAGSAALDYFSVVKYVTNKNIPSVDRPWSQRFEKTKTKAKTKRKIRPKAKKAKRKK